jgi:3-oxoisoapionate kinase
MRPAPYLCFYGDDFTGSTDVLDSLSNAGIRTVLFLALPDESTLRKLVDVEAIGLAGMSRSMTPDAMASALPAIFRWMAASRASILHYKICSTFDSSPCLGSIGKAMEIALAELGTPLIPILVGVPKLGRYCVFGSLFARAGANSEVYRLDRHPVMSHHPVTPMMEADLRRHLSLQTNLRIGLVSVIDIEMNTLPPEDAGENGEWRGVLFDTISTDHLKTVGQWLHRYADHLSQPLFCVGSSAVEYALVEQWPGRHCPPTRRGCASVGSGAPIAVVSGSCSSITARQIDFAASRDFALIPLSVIALSSANAAQEAHRQAVRTALAALEQGRSPLVFTSHGESDPGFRNAIHAGEFLGRILKEIVDTAQINRVAVAGGDTSGFVAQGLEIEALEVAAPISPGAPLCKAHRVGGRALEIALKGGQMGSDDYFVRVRDAA